MKSICLTLIGGLCFLLSFSQKNINDPNAEKRKVASFHAIHASDGIDLYLTQGNEDALAVSAGKTEYRDRIVSVVENGVLRLYYKKNGVDKLWSNRKLKAYISFKQLDELQASGGSDVQVEGSLKSKLISIKLSGGADMNARLDCGSVELDASGGSDADLSGKVVNLRVTASGGSDCNAYELSSDFAEIQVSGGSDVTITVNRELTATASGGSDLHYRGNAVVKKTSSSGGGSVNKRG